MGRGLEREVANSRLIAGQVFGDSRRSSKSQSFNKKMSEPKMTPRNMEKTKRTPMVMARARARLFQTAKPTEIVIRMVGKTELCRTFVHVTYSLYTR